MIHHARSLLYGLLGCALAGVGCTTDEATDPAAGASAQARFELSPDGAPALLDVPFPSDLYRSAHSLANLAGMEVVAPKNGSHLAAALAQTEGFGRIAGALFRIDDPHTGAPAEIDPESLPRSEAETTTPATTALLVDVEAPDASAALVPCRVDYRDDRPVGATTPPVLAIYPARGVVLAPAHRYAAVVTTGVRTTDGRRIGPSDTFRAVRDGLRRATLAERLYGDAVDRVEALVPALAGARAIAALTVYTTNDAEREILDLRARFAAAPPPPLSWDPAKLAPMGAGLFAGAPLPAGYTATLDAWLGAPAKLADGRDDPADDQSTGKPHEAIAAIGTALFEAPNLLLDRKGFDDPEHATFARDAAGDPETNPARPTSKIWVTIALPKGPMPPSGFPTVIVQHGLSNDRSMALAFANTFAERGWATAAIESVTFGARSPRANGSVDAQVGFPWSKNPGAYDGPDGLVDDKNGPIDFFGGMLNIGAARDQMRQSILDISAFGDVLRNPLLDLGPLLAAVPGAKLDPDRMALVGDSLGAIMAAFVAAIDPHLTTFVLNVGGAGIIQEVAHAPAIALAFAGAGEFNFGLEHVRLAPSHPVIQLMEHIVDAGDPLAYARHIILEPATVGGVKNVRKNVLQIEVLWDEDVSNEASEALARAAGFALAEPSTGTRTGVPLISAKPSDGAISGLPFEDGTAVIIQASPAAHGADLYDAMGQHTFAHPYAQFDSDAPFSLLVTPFEFPQPYRALQSTVVGFLESSFAGDVPVVQGFPKPTLDFDADGVVDAKDADPNDPTKH